MRKHVSVSTASQSLDSMPFGSVPCLSKTRTNEFHIVKVILQIVQASLLYIEKTAEFRKYY